MPAYPCRSQPMPVNSMVLAAILVSTNALLLPAQVVPTVAQGTVPYAILVRQPHHAAPVSPLRDPCVPLIQQPIQGINRQVMAFCNPVPSPVPCSPTTSEEKSLLQISRSKTTDEALLDFFRKRTLPTPPRPVLEQLAQTLASPKPEEADAAQAELISRGTPVAAVVRQIANRIDQPQAAQRAKQILQILEGPLAPNLPIEIARLLAIRRPPGAAEVLLDYLAVADNDNILGEVIAALAAIVGPINKPNAAIMAALHSPQAFRRVAAAQILCQAAGSTNLQAVRPLMKDADPTVRLKATLALADAYDQEAILGLIGWMGETPSPLQGQAEKYLTQLAGTFAVRGPRGQDVLSCQLRYQTWLTWWKQTSGPHLLQVLQAHTLTDEEWKKAQTSLRQLGGSDVQGKESAIHALYALGRRVVPLLRRAVEEQPPPSRSAAERCLHRLESTTPFSPLPEAVLRLLQLRRPAGTVAALLAYLPCAEDEAVVERIQEALVRTGIVDNKADRTLVQALQSKIGLRRRVAATVLCRGRATKTLASVRKLLRDKDLEVRQHVAQELALIGDKDAIVQLVGLLEALPEDRVWAAEECLERLAGHKAPAAVRSGEEISWSNVRRAWLEWWVGDKSKVVMEDVESCAHYEGFTLLVQPHTGSVTELDRDGRPRWTLKGLANPRDAQVVSDRRVLVLEQGTRVTERTIQGKVLWEKRTHNGVVNIQRLRNGNTFIACHDRLIEVNRRGKEVLTIPCPRGVVAARKLSNGRYALSDARNVLVQLDRYGGEVKSARLGGGGSGRYEILDNGHVLITALGLGVLEEYDADGKRVGQFRIQGALYGYRLTNGHTLLTVWDHTPRYIELDKNWKPIKETRLDTPAVRVKRR